jgi:glycolate dehydrogenase FAD-binding subunit
MPRQLTPAGPQAAAAALSGAAAGGEAVRIVGAGTKSRWGGVTRAPDIELHTAKLDRIIEHNQGDLTAVLEAGLPLARAQRQFASAGQMLAVDPFLGPGHEATVGGVLATADSGPMRHRYGAPRDLVLGMTVALSDGTLASSGGKVIKNVAGYDLGKLFTGSFGTLGLIVSVSVRLHPLPSQTVTVLGESDETGTVAAAAAALFVAPLELEALDVAWRGGRGGLLAQCAGAAGARRAERIAQLMRQAGVERVEITGDDAELWARQRSGQRSSAGALMRVAARPSALPAVLEAVQASGATAVGRAAVGHSFVDLDPGALGTLLAHLPRGAVAVLLDAPDELRAAVDPWGEPADVPALELMRRVKERFDPAGACNPGVFVGGI